MPRPPEAGALKGLEQEVELHRTQFNLITEALNVKKVRAESWQISRAPGQNRQAPTARRRSVFDALHAGLVALSPSIRQGVHLLIDRYGTSTRQSTGRIHAAAMQAQAPRAEPSVSPPSRPLQHRWSATAHARRPAPRARRTSSAAPHTTSAPRLSRSCSSSARMPCPRPPSCASRSGGCCWRLRGSARGLWPLP